MLIAWGKNDEVCPAAAAGAGAGAGAEPYKRDLKNLAYHLLDAGHLAIGSDGETIAALIRDFLGRHVMARRATPRQAR